MQHFLEISSLSPVQIRALIQRGLELKNSKKYPGFSDNTVALLFYENSTRTKISFDIAARNLSLRVVDVDVSTSSESKGEVMADTISTLYAMGIQTFVIRHSQNHIQQELAHVAQNNMHIVNAGDGTHAHPSQAILDMMTIVERKPDLSRLKIAVVGNIKHSRVASSFQCICQKLGVGELVLVAPEVWSPETAHYGRVTTSLQDGLDGADVVMCLRVQKERILAEEIMDLASYRADFALTEQQLLFAKKDALVMHPGPINRGVEIDSMVADGPQSVILQQVTNGVYARMAILEALCS